MNLCFSYLFHSLWTPRKDSQSPFWLRGSARTGSKRNDILNKEIDVRLDGGTRELITRKGIHANPTKDVNHRQLIKLAVNLLVTIDMR